MNTQELRPSNGAPHAHLKRHHIHPPSSGRGYRSPSLRDLAKKWGTRPISPVRLLEATHNYEEATEVYTAQLETALSARDIVSSIIASIGKNRTDIEAQMQRKGSARGSGKITLPPSLVVANPRILEDEMTARYWQTEPPVAIAVATGLFHREHVIHEVGPFEDEQRYRHAAQILLARSGLVQS